MLPHLQLIPYEPEHIATLAETEDFAYLRQFLDTDYPVRLKGPNSFTGLLNGKPIFCAGVIEIWEGRGEAWAIFDRNCKPFFLKIHRVVKAFLKTCPIRRIEAVVACEFEAGHRWVRALGFTLEATVMRAYRVGGRDAALYSMVKEGKTA